jgi:hypothetical protein
MGFGADADTFYDLIDTAQSTPVSDDGSRV